MRSIHVIAPPLARCAGAPSLQQMLARADKLEASDAGYISALQAQFQWPGRSFPVAALTREHACHDASTGIWLCADLAWIEPDIHGARMLGCGGLDVDESEAHELARGLRPLFGDAGFQLELTTPSRWHLRLPDGARLPDFDSPEQALGADLLAHLPKGDTGKRWRMLFNEAQMILHQSPVSAARRQAGKQPANSLWFWGGGAWPAWFKSHCTSIFSDDPIAIAAGAAAKIATQPVKSFDAATVKQGDCLLDLERVNDLEAWCEHLHAALRAGFDALQLAFSSGERFRYRRRHRWRIWRRGI